MNGVNYTDNTAQFHRLLDRNINSALNEMGKFGVKKLTKHAAKDTGFMRSRNDYKVTMGNWVDIGNYGCDYSIFQEFGTYKMTGQPFVRPTAFNYQNNFIRIFKREITKGIR
jgi:HK97 gp10 family phage protein